MAKKRIGIVARGLTQGGVGKFVTEVLGEYDKKPPKDADINVITDEPSFVTQYPKLEVVVIKKRFKLLWDYVLLLQILLKLNLDSVLYTKNIIPFTHLFGSWKKVVVVYDLAFMYPELQAYKFFDSLYMRTFLGISLRIANTVCSISQFTKDEILKFYPSTAASKIQVIHLGVSEKYFSKVSEKRKQALISKLDLKLPFIFYCGSISPRKNILRLIKAFEQVADTLPHQLYLVSGTNWNANEVFEYWQQSYYKGRITFIDFLSEDELITLYNLANGFVYISLYEGFGLPIIEAQASRCPLIAGNIISSLEVGGDGANYVDPYEIQSISSAILSTVIDKKIVDVQVGSGSKNAKRYTWSVTSGELLHLMLRLFY